MLALKEHHSTWQIFKKSLYLIYDSNEFKTTVHVPRKCSKPELILPAPGQGFVLRVLLGAPIRFSAAPAIGSLR